MLDWLGYIGELITHFISMLSVIPGIAFDSITLITSSFGAAPTFLFPLLTATVSVAVIMWVVNLF